MAHRPALDRWRAVAVALVAVAIAALIRIPLTSVVRDRLPYTTFFAAVIVSGLYGGLGPGLLAVGLSALLSVVPSSPLRFGAVEHIGSVEQIGLVLFLGTGGFVAWVAALARNARRQAEESGRHARETLESITGGFFAVDAGWCVTYLNEAGARMFRMMPEQLLGRSLWEAFPVIVGTPLEDQYRGAMRERRPAELEYHAASGAWYGIKVYPTADGGLAFHFTDVSESKRHLEALRHSEARFREAITRAPIPVILHAEDGEVLLVSEEFERLTGYRLAEIRSFDAWLSLAYGERATGVADVVRRQFEAVNEVSRGDYRVRMCDGSRRTWSFTVGPPGRLPDGRRYLVAMANDVTEREEAERGKTELLASERAARAAAENANRTKDEFLATLSHELRTPLHAILGWTQILRRADLDAGTRERGLDIVERNARAQTRLIDELLDMSRIISGKLKLELSTVHLESIVEVAAEALRPNAEARGVTVELALDRDTGTLTADAGRLQQVIGNLLSNAIKFTPRGGSVRIALARTGDDIEIRVADTGEGIAPEFLPHVFERFRQADGSTSRPHAGLGVGLAVVKHLVEMHGGSVRAESAGPGRGATFTVRLPALAGRPEPREPAPAAGGDDAACPRTLTGVRVLVVDDEDDARELVRLELERCEAVVATAASAGEALRLVESFGPAVLVSDVAMPGQDGYALIRRVRGMPAEQGGRVPAIALTAFARSEDRTRAMLAGYQAHLSKPVETAELIATVAALVGRAGR